MKAQYIFDNGFGGATFWALDLVGFKNQACSEGPYPLLSAVKRVLTTASPPTNAPTVVPTGKITTRFYVELDTMCFNEYFKR